MSDERNEIFSDQPTKGSDMSEMVRVGKGSLPVPEPSTEGHIQAYGGEMRTWIVQGAATGLAIGAVVGIGLYFAVMTGMIFIPLLDGLRVSSPVLFAVAVLFLSSIVGAAGGAVIGLGTPRFNPHPQQGWVAQWSTFILRRKNRDKFIYVPQFKSPNVEARRQGQRG